MLLKGKIILITGASKGIGKAIAQLFAVEGACLILTSRNVIALEELKDSLPAHSGEHYIYQTDVKDYNSVKNVFDDLKNKNVFIDCLVNNAGIMKDSTLQMLKQDTIKDIYETNVYGVMYNSQLALKSFLRKRAGSIINLSSIIGTNGSVGQSVYSSSKAALIGFTKSLGKELAPLNIRVNAIAPGFIDTDLTKNQDAKFYEKNLQAIGMKRFGTPEDVAKVALFLASDLSLYVTGQVIGVDGGMII